MLKGILIGFVTAICIVAIFVLTLKFITPGEFWDLRKDHADIIRQMELDQNKSSYRFNHLSEDHNAIYGKLEMLRRQQCNIEDKLNILLNIATNNAYTIDSCRTGTKSINGGGSTW